MSPILTAWIQLLIFLGASALMIWRLEKLSQRGFEGTVLGTLVMPYCSGLPNLIFAYTQGGQGGSGVAVIENCVVNNVSNLTLLLGLPALLWGLSLKPAGKKNAGLKGKAGELFRINKLSLLLTLLAVFFFTLTAWLLVREDGQFKSSDGWVLMGIFFFWQIFQVFDVLKSNVRQKRSFGILLVLDLAIILLCGYGIYVSVDWIFGQWLPQQNWGIFRSEYAGWLSGWLMILPNALLAFYYARSGRADVVFSSQIGDGHICIPLCLGLFVVSQNNALSVPATFETAVFIICGATVLHFFLLLFFSRLPRFVGAALVLAYGYFLYAGLVQV